MLGFAAYVRLASGHDSARWMVVHETVMNGAEGDNDLVISYLSW